jgi:hypothetical protein
MTSDMMEIENLLSKSAAWLPKAMEQVGCTAQVNVTSAACKRAMKDTLAMLFVESFHLVRFQHERMKQLKAELSSTKTQLIENQKWVISLQEKVVDCKEKQLEAVQTAVKVTVEDSVKEQFKCYSDVIQENVMVCQPESPSISPTVLKEVVQSVVQQEDRSRNLMVFGITEDEREDLPTRVQEVFQHIGFKPTMEVCRVGKVSREKKKTRPVKVTLYSSSVASQILSQARRLHKSTDFGSVFVRPDRSEEERSQNRLLVEELIKRRRADPKKRHFIQGGTIHSVEGVAS